LALAKIMERETSPFHITSHFHIIIISMKKIIKEPTGDNLNEKKKL